MATKTGGEISDFDLHLFQEGKHKRLWEVLGAHPETRDGVAGTRFAVWAPNAAVVSVTGDFNGWVPGATPLAERAGFGVWEGFVPGVGAGTRYKFAITSRFGGYEVQKADPFAFAFEQRPQTASVVQGLGGYYWGDSAWMKARPERNGLDAPMAVYEVHLGSWMRVPEDGDRWLTYKEIAPQLAAYCVEMGFTHVELLPLNEHPFDGSWGYQSVGYYAPTSRFGTPQDLMYLVDTLHQAGVGVLLDWVPAHFPKDEHGLGYFDGTHLYEHADPRQGTHRDWGTFVFNYGRNEVRNFLVANARYWLEVYHLDGIRVDAVASMLYLDYSRDDGEWIPNEFGGRENLEAIEFLKEVNAAVAEAPPGALSIAEESTAWPMVSRPTYLGGLGFSMKWNMGWMHDTLAYVGHDPVHRAFHHHKMTFALMYAFHENFVLAYSHDEVVHGKGSMLGKMAGDPWQRFANLRLTYGWMWAHPGKKLLFMGGEFGQVREWDHDRSLDWHLLDEAPHAGVRAWVRDLNHLLKAEPALHELDFEEAGFRWVDCNDTINSVYSFLRWDKAQRRPLLCVFHFTPLVREGYRLGVPAGGRWEEVLNSDAAAYGGRGVGNFGGVDAEAEPAHGEEHSVEVTLPPLGVLVFRPVEPLPPPEKKKPKKAKAAGGGPVGIADAADVAGAPAAAAPGARSSARAAEAPAETPPAREAVVPAATPPAGEGAAPAAARAATELATAASGRALAAPGGDTLETAKAHPKAAAPRATEPPADEADPDPEAAPPSDPP